MYLPIQPFLYEIQVSRKVRRLLKTVDSRKATGLDNIPCTLSKLAANIDAPSLTHIFNGSISVGIFPS